MARSPKLPGTVLTLPCPRVVPGVPRKTGEMSRESRGVGFNPAGGRSGLGVSRSTVYPHVGPLPPLLFTWNVKVSRGWRGLAVNATAANSRKCGHLGEETGRSTAWSYKLPGTVVTLSCPRLKPPLYAGMLGSFQAFHVKQEKVSKNLAAWGSTQPRMVLGSARSIASSTWGYCWPLQVRCRRDCRELAKVPGRSGRDWWKHGAEPKLPRTVVALPCRGPKCPLYCWPPGCVRLSGRSNVKQGK